MITGLWWIALPLTGGGWNYANRVLAPALVLAGALAGWLTVLSRPLRMALPILLLIFAVDAGRRAWLLPSYPYAAPWPYTLDVWRKDRTLLQSVQSTPVWGVLIGAAAGRAIVVDHPSNHAQVTRLGGNAVPWFSPDVRSMFTENTTFAEAQRELRANGVRFVTLHPSEAIVVGFYRKFPFLRELTTRCEPVATVQGLRIYDLDLIASPPPAPSSLP